MKSFFYIFIITILAVLVSIPLIDARYLTGHDPAYNLMRLVQVHNLLSSGILLPKWAPDLVFGFGYPIFIFYPAMSYYLAEIFVILGTGFGIAIKLGYFLGFLFGGWFFYKIGERIGSKKAGITGAALFCYVPYRLVDVYVRSSYSEFIAISIVPFIIWSVLSYHKRNHKRYLLFMLIGLCLINLTHTISAFLFFPSLFLMAMILSIRNKQNMIRFIVVFALACAITSFFWVPALVEQKYVDFSSMTQGNFCYRNHFVYLSQFFSQSWGFGLSVLGKNDTMPFQIGYPQQIAVLVCIGLILVRKNKYRNLCFLSVGLTLISIFFMTESSSFLWDKIKVLQMLQFPWRLLMVVGVFSSFCGVIGSKIILDKIRNTNLNRIFFVLILILIIGFNQKFCQAEYIDDKNFETLLVKNINRLPLPEGSSTILLEHLPRWVKVLPDKLPAQKIESSQNIRILKSEITPTKYDVDILVKKSDILKINTFYYPGWNIYLDGRRIKPIIDNRLGIMKVYVDQKGEHNLKIVFQNTALRNTYNTVSLLAVLATAIFFVYYKKFNYLLSKI